MPAAFLEADYTHLSNTPSLLCLSQGTIGNELSQGTTGNKLLCKGESIYVERDQTHLHPLFSAGI